VGGVDRKAFRLEEIIFEVGLFGWRDGPSKCNDRAVGFSPTGNRRLATSKDVKSKRLAIPRI
jgi:hypothetical protein